MHDGLLILICLFLECEDGLYGINCLYRCYCNGATCDRMMGKCNCSAGWTGMACEKGTLIFILCFSKNECIYISFSLHT